MRPQLCDFCDTAEEIHAIELGFFTPLFMWPLFMRGLGLSLLKEEPHYVAFGIFLRTIALTATGYALWRKHESSRRLRRVSNRNK